MPVITEYLLGFTVIALVGLIAVMAAVPVLERYVAWRENRRR